MRHHGEVPPGGVAQTRDAVRGTVGVERVLLGGLAGVVDVTHASLAAREDVGHPGLVGELNLALAVRDPDADARTLHTLQHHSGGVGLDPDGGPTALEPSRVVVDETRLLHVVGGAQAALRGDEPEESHELAAVADTKREGIGSVVKRLELRPERLVESDAARPALRGVEDVGVAEPAAEDDPAEIFEPHGAGEQVGHGDVPRLHARGVDRGAHLAVTVGALLAEDANLHLVGLFHHVHRGLLRGVGEFPCRRLAIAEAALLRRHRRLGRLHALEEKRGVLPGIAKVRDGSFDHGVGGAGNLDGRDAVRGRLTDRRHRHAGGIVRLLHGFDVGRVNLDDDGELLGEQRRHRVARGVG